MVSVAKKLMRSFKNKKNKKSKDAPKEENLEIQVRESAVEESAVDEEREELQEREEVDMEEKAVMDESPAKSNVTEDGENLGSGEGTMEEKPADEVSLEENDETKNEDGASPKSRSSEGDVPAGKSSFVDDMEEKKEIDERYEPAEGAKLENKESHEGGETADEDGMREISKKASEAVKTKNEESGDESPEMKVVDEQFEQPGTLCSIALCF